jgi:hypothetical protein
MVLMALLNSQVPFLFIAYSSGSLIPSGLVAALVGRDGRGAAHITVSAQVSTTPLMTLVIELLLPQPAVTA